MPHPYLSLYCKHKDFQTISTGLQTITQNKIQRLWNREDSLIYISVRIKWIIMDSEKSYGLQACCDETKLLATVLDLI